MKTHESCAYELNCHMENKMNEFWISKHQIKKLKEQLKYEKMNTGRCVCVWWVGVGISPIYYSALFLGPAINLKNTLVKLVFLVMTYNKFGSGL